MCTHVDVENIPTQKITTVMTMVRAASTSSPDEDQSNLLKSDRRWRLTKKGLRSTKRSSLRGRTKVAKVGPLRARVKSAKVRPTPYA